jgi:outer membrane protein assembly factor BamB
LWELEIPTDVISAPVVADGKVYFTCFDGSSFAVNAADGRVKWRKQGTGTSAPVVAQGQVVLTRKAKVGDRTYEGLERSETRDGKEKDQNLLARSEADYLNEGNGSAMPLSLAMQKALDSSVGFGSAPPAAKLATLADAVGVGTVVGGWAYQGSRAALRSGKILNAQGRYLNAVDATTGKALWRAEASGPKVDKNAQLFSPPALGQNYLYVGSTTGVLAAVRQQDGEAVFLYALNHPIVFQPALARGKVYIGTGDGMIICLNTGSSDADGWYAWGGNAQHNK